MNFEFNQARINKILIIIQLFLWGELAIKLANRWIDADGHISTWP